MKITFYLSKAGRAPVMDFLRAQPSRSRAAVLEALDRVEHAGLSAPGVSFRQISGKLWEIRVQAGAAVRVFYVLVSGEGREATMVLLHAYVKGSHRTPGHERNVAMRRLKEVVRG